MDIKELKVADRVLVQSGRYTCEHAKVMNLDAKSNKAIMKLSDGSIVAMEPQYILKSFGPL